MSIRQEVLEAKLVEKFRAALTPDMLDYLVAATNQALAELQGATPLELKALVKERGRIEAELSNLVEFVVKGDMASPRLREEIHAREHRLVALDQQLERLRATGPIAPIRIDRAWLEARREIQKHVEDLRIAPAPEVDERTVRVTGHGKLHGLLGGEEAVRLQLVAGAGFEPATFGL